MYEFNKLIKLYLNKFLFGEFENIKLIIECFIDDIWKYSNNGGV